MKSSATVCTICRRGPRVAFNRPHSLHRTKRVVQINLQKWNGMRICTRCRRTLTRYAIA